MKDIREITDFIVLAGSDDLMTFGGMYEGGAHIQQIPDELARFIQTLMIWDSPIDSFLEIGSAAGGMVYVIDHFFDPDTIVIIDDNKHHKAGLRPVILDGIDRLELIGKSQDENIIASAQEHGPYDLVMIDGDHLYPGVKLDIMFYAPMLRQGGYLAFHDSALEEWGVMRAVKELKEDPRFEFIDEYRSESHHRALGIALFKRCL